MYMYVLPQSHAYNIYTTILEGVLTNTVDVNKMFTKSFTDHVSISDQ